MEINNDIKDLILEYTGRYFRFENDFLQTARHQDAPIMPTGKSSKTGTPPSQKMGAGTSKRHA